MVERNFVVEEEELDPEYERSKVFVPPARVSWGAIFAGIFIALVVQLLLGMVGLAVGLGTFDPASETSPFSGFGVGTGIWLIVQTLIALFVGGWAAGRLSGKPRGLDGLLHGAVVWAAATLFFVFGFANFTANVVGGITKAVGAGVSATASAARGAVRDADVDRGQALQVVKSEAQQILRETDKPELQPENLEQRAEGLGQVARDTAREMAEDPQQADETLSRAIDRTFGRFGGALEEADRQALVNVITARTDMTEAEANRAVDNWVASYRRAVPEDLREDPGGTLRESVEDATDKVARGLWWTVLAFLLGGIAACIGGWLGSPSLEQWRASIHRRHHPFVGIYDRDLA